FDFAVNSGPARAAKYLQAVLGVAQDGRVGPQTIAAAEKANARDVIDALCDNRLAFLKRIKNNGKLMWETFGKGWSRRVEDVRKTAQLMVGHPADVKEVVREVSVPVDKPTVPMSVENEVKQKTGLWSWITGLFSSGALGLGWLAGMDWQAIVAIGGVVLVFLAVILLMRRQIIAGVKEIREGLV
ncbi:putative peptidoglycan-binding domain-containing protein, partial [Aminobacter sp. J41]